MAAPDADSPTEPRPGQPPSYPPQSPPRSPPPQSGPTSWIGAAPVPAGGAKRRRRFADDTLDLPADERAALEAPQPQIQYVPVPVYPPGYEPPGHESPRYEPPGYEPPGSRRRRRADRPPHPAPPPQYPPQYREPRRRRRKWPWVFAFFTLCCLGVCGSLFAWIKPFYDQYPATAYTTATVTGLTVVKDQALSDAAHQLSPAINSGQLGEARFSVVYAEAGNSRRRATVFGTTRFVTDPAKDLTGGLDKLTGKLQLTGVQDVDAGPLGGVQRCGGGRLDGRTVAVCGWADHGSLGVGVFTNRSAKDSAPLLQTIRAAVIRRG